MLERSGVRVEAKDFDADGARLVEAVLQPEGVVVVIVGVGSPEHVDVAAHSDVPKDQQGGVSAKASKQAKYTSKQAGSR